MTDGNKLRNQLKSIRTRLGLSQLELATKAGVARQTIGGIEAELYAPSAVVALHIARALGCRVEDIFWLDGDRGILNAVPGAAMPTNVPLRLTLAEVAGTWVAFPLHADTAFRSEMVPADGFGTLLAGSETVSVTLLDDVEALARTVVIAGCTPALSLWARSAERWFPGLRVNWRHANSMEALSSLARGEVHAAGVHLYDPVTREHNSSFVRRALRGRPAALVNLGVWNEGFVVQPGNPNGLQCAADLTRDNVVLVNREEGAGSRLLLDTLLAAECVEQTSIHGYGRSVASHQEIALAVATGQADVGVSTESVAQTYGLGFVKLREVRYDLAVLEEYVQHEPIRQLLSTLQHRWVRSQLEMLGGYDTTETGKVTRVAPLPPPSP